MDEVDRLLVMTVLIMVCGSFISMHVNVAGDAYVVSYTIDKSRNFAQVYVNLRPQALYVWDTNDPLMLDRIDYASFAQPGQLNFKTDIAFLGSAGVKNFAVDYHLNDTVGRFYLSCWVFDT